MSVFYLYFRMFSFLVCSLVSNILMMWTPSSIYFVLSSHWMTSNEETF